MKKTDKLRLMIAQEAARIMYEEKILEYRDAKRKAAKRFGSVESLSLGSHLPSNAEIHRELQLLIGMFEEKVLPGRRGGNHRMYGLPPRGEAKDFHEQYHR